MASATIQLIITATNRAKQALMDVAKDIDKMSTEAARSVDKNAKAYTDFQEKVKKTISDVQGAWTVLQQGAGTIKEIYDFSKESAQMLRLKDTGDMLAKSYGTNMDVMVKALKKASLGTVSEMAIIQSMNKAMLLNIGADVDKMSNLMQIAAIRGRAMGLSTQEAFDEIVRGIGRMSPLILDNLGIVMDAEVVFTNYAASIGKNKEELNAFEKRQALLNATLDDGNRILSETNGLLEDSATAYERNAAAMEDVINNIKLWWAENSNLAASVNAIFFRAQTLTGAVEEQGKAMLSLTDNYHEYFMEQTRLSDITGINLRKIQEMTGVYDTLSYAVKKVDQQLLAHNATYKDYASAQQRQADQMGITVEQYRELSQVTDEFIWNSENTYTAIVRTSEEQDNLNMGIMRSLPPVQMATNALARYSQQNLLTGQTIAEVAQKNFEAGNGYIVTSQNVDAAYQNMVAAQNNLTAVQQNYAQGVGSEVVQILGTRLYEGGQRYIEGLKATDEALGTNYYAEYEHKKAIEDAANAYANTGDMDAYKAKLKDISAQELPALESAAAKAADEAERIYEAMAALERMQGTFTFEIIMSIVEDLGDGGGGGDDGSSPPNPWVPIPLANKGDPFSGRYGGSGVVHETTGASGFSGIVPPGYPNDSFDFLGHFTSGERIQVTPANKVMGNGGGGGDGVVVVVNYSPQISLGDRYEAEYILAPIIMKTLRDARVV